MGGCSVDPKNRAHLVAQIVRISSQLRNWIYLELKILISGQFDGGWGRLASQKGDVKTVSFFLALPQAKYSGAQRSQMPSFNDPGCSVVKNPPADTGDMCSIPGLGISPGEGNGNPLQYSCLVNPMDGGAYSSWGRKRVRHNLETKQQKTSAVDLGKLLNFSNLMLHHRWVLYTLKNCGCRVMVVCKV